MSRLHDKTIIHVRPILERQEPVTAASPEPPGVPLSVWLAVAVGIALLIFILAALLVFCCCCSACPLYEWRRRRRKKRREREAALAWRHKSAQFTTPMFEPPAEANGKLPLMPDDDVGEKTAQRFESSAPAAGWKEPTPSVLTASDLNTSRSPSVMLSTDFHRKSNTMSVSTRGGVWEVEALHSSPQGETSWVDSCVLTADSRHLLTGSTHGPPCLWDLQTGSFLHALEGLDAASGGLVLAASDRVLVAMVQEHNRDCTRMQMWDMSTCSRVHIGFPLFVSAICALRGRPQVVLAQYDPVSDANPALVVWDVLANEEVSVIPFQHPVGMSADGGLTFLKATFDDRFVLTAFTNLTTHQTCFMVFDLEVHHGDHILDPLVIPMDARLECTVVSAGRPEAVTGTRDGQVVVWDLRSGAPMRQLLESGPGSPAAAEIVALVNSHDGQLLVSGDSAGIVHLWDGRAERWLATVHMPQLTAVAVSRDAGLVATGSSAGAVHLWRSSGAPLAKVAAARDVASLVLAPDASALVALGSRASPHDAGMVILRLSPRR